MSIHFGCCSSLNLNNLLSPPNTTRSSLYSNFIARFPSPTTADLSTWRSHADGKLHGSGALRCTNHIGSGGTAGDYGGTPLVSPPRQVASNVSPDDVSNIITEELFEEMLPYRNDRRCPAKGFYTYEAFLTAARRFPAFGATGTMEARKRELAAFFGQTSHETRGGLKDAPEGRCVWGYCHIRQVNPPRDYCVASEKWPAVPGQKYYGRGPIQLTFNWNYGQAGTALGLDLLSNPDLVATDAVVSFSAAIWFWMTPQHRKPSCHDVILGAWTPNEADLVVNRLPGYGVLTNIINPGECGHGANRSVASRIAFYKRYCGMLGVSPGDNLDCYEQCRF